MIAVLLVGGEGTRLRPLTEWLPKPMLPIANRPFLEHQIGHLRRHGIDRVVMACGYLSDSIREHFGDQLSYRVEPEPLGTGGAIRFAAADVDETFVVCNGDVLTDLDLSAQVRMHRRRGARATLAVHEVADAAAYGLVESDDDGRVTRFVEKGATGPGGINAGSYVMEPDVLELIEPGRAVSVEREVFPRLIGDGLFARTDGARWRDIGTPESYLWANLEQMPAGGLIDPTATIDEGAQLIDCVVGPGAHVQAGARLERCVVLEGAPVPSTASFRERVIGRDGRPVW